MVYIPEEKARMDRLLHAFRSYVDTNEYYDIVYSRKAGFLRVCVGDGADSIYFPINGFDDMLRMFIDDHIQDEEQRMEQDTMTDYDRVRRQLLPILNTLEEEREYALSFMEQQFENCGNP